RGLLEGTINHRLPGPLTDYVVAFGNRVYLPRYESEWYPGEPIDLGSAAFDRRDLDAFLTGKTATRIERKPGEGGQEYVVSESAYDPLATETADVVRMLTFHDAAGGRGYTGLTNVALASDDLSPQLRLGRAVVLGRLEAPAAEVSVTADGGAAFERARRATFVRFVLPAAPAEVAPSPALPTLAPTEEAEPVRPPQSG
ncbi:MAG TPA: hypothetical protein VF170_02905, partial [Planctomycetaceae bacterium]